VSVCGRVWGGGAGEEGRRGANARKRKTEKGIQHTYTHKRKRAHTHTHTCTHPRTRAHMQCIKLGTERNDAVLFRKQGKTEKERVCWKERVRRGARESERVIYL